MERRSFLKHGLDLGAVAASIGANPAAAIAPTEKRFSKDFVWGCATSAYQVEGAATVDGRGQTNWDVLSHTYGKVKGGDTGDEACDSYRRFAEDSALLKALGARGYRMSVSWARIFPDGRGQPNMKGVDH